MPLAPSSERSRQLLATPLDQIRGVGPSAKQKLARLNLNTVEDLLLTLPLRYEDRREIRRIAQLRDGMREFFHAEILACGEVQTPRSRRRLYEVIVGDGSGQLLLKWFHYRKEWMAKRYRPGTRIFVSGEVKRFGAVREIHHPDIEFMDEGGQAGEDYGRILPVYPLTEGLTQKTARKIWKEVVTRFAPETVSDIPADIASRQRLLPLAEALQQVHWPPPDSTFANLESGCDPARRTLVFDEFFFLELGLALKRRGHALESGIPFQINHRYTKPLVQMLPFRLTDAQRRVLGEIKVDLMSPHPMNRLVQGDVGCGKTVVALLSALLAIENETQVAVVAPTEILAEQHYLQFHHWLEQLGLRAVLLSGSQTPSERRSICQQIRSGAVHMVVGTHAVLQEGVEFLRLGLGIIDEQHRFGVKQRAVLRHKGINPHILVMTATPIPRTLALTLYGDLALSVIDELPPNRSPVATRVVTDGARQRVYEFIRKEIAAGHQAYIVYPLVEETEKTDLSAATQGIEQLRAHFPEVQLGLLHGRLRPEEKEQVMTSFKERQLSILVATTVVEVGVDVPNATVMVVEHAERFGLAQLHQLRGRVGRGASHSHCFLMRSTHCSEDGRRRLQVMEQTNDGFRIAEADLEIRGPGEFLGTRQSGLPDFRIASLLRDHRILEEARTEALQLASRPDFFTSQKFTALRTTLMKRWGSRLELANIG